MSFHVYPSCEYFAFRLEVSGPHLNLSRPQCFAANTLRREGTPPIGHAGRSYRGRFRRQEGERSLEMNLRFETQVESVKSKAQTAQEQQRQKVVYGHGQDLNRKPQRRGVSRGKVINYRRQKHVQQTAAYLLAAAGPRTASQLHLRDGLAAKRALGQMRGHVLSAVSFPEGLILVLEPLLPRLDSRRQERQAADEE